MFQIIEIFLIKIYQLKLELYYYIIAFNQMASKLVHQQLKNTIRSITDQEIEKFLTVYETLSGFKIEKQCKMISYKW